MASSSSVRVKLVTALIVLLIAGAVGFKYRGWVVQNAGLAFNYYRSWNAPRGTLVVESSSSAPATIVPAPSPLAPPGAKEEWPSYNRTLTSERYSPLSQINRGNVASLKVLCTYDTKEMSGNQEGPLVVNGALIGTTEADIFSIDASTCTQRWRTHEVNKQNAVNRGAAYLDGQIFRGTGDGRVLAYDFNSGARVWERSIASADAGETIPAAPIAWNGLVFIGNAGGDRKGVKGRMYALDAKSGEIVWEFYLVPKAANDQVRGPQAPSQLDTSSWMNQTGTPITGGATWTSYTLDPERGELYVPAGNSAPDFAPDMRKGENLYSGSVVVLDAKTGAYKRHFLLTAGDWHDWDVSNTPTLVRTQGGQRLMAIAPKNGRLYGFNLDSGALDYSTEVNRIENADAPFSPDKPVHFCPGARGGAEWNGPAFDPLTNLIFVGSVEWCTTVTLQTEAQIKVIKPGKYFVGMDSHNPYHTFGEQDSYHHWAGWLYAVDADSGTWRWRAKSNFPVQSGLAPTAGGLVFFGDMGGNFYALDAASGHQLWGGNLGGAIGGGVITYSGESAPGAVSQRIAVAVGFNGILWPTKVTTAKIVILGLGG